MRAQILLSKRAVRDLQRLGAARPRVAKLLDALAADPRAPNLDLRGLKGRAPWSRARVGPYRLILRLLTTDEARRAIGEADPTYLIDRIVHRRDLDRVIAKL